jgi:hypothetical protein
MLMRIIPTPPGVGRHISFGLACVAMLTGACVSSDSPAAGTGGATSTPATGGSTGATSTGGASATPGSGGATVASTGGATSTASGGAVGSGGVPGLGGTPAAGGRGVGGSGTSLGGSAGPAGGASGSCNGAALCDSFERATIGPGWVADNSVPATVIEVVTNKAHSGTNSVHISFGTVVTQSYISESLTFPAMGGAFWGRAWIFSMVPLAGHQIYVEARVAAGSDRTGVRPVNTQGMTLALNLESSDAGTNSTMQMMMGSWVCYEWQITGIGAAGTFSSWANGTLLGKQNGAIPNLMRQRIGFQRYAAGPAGEMWIDDVAIGANRIGCTN